MRTMVPPCETPASPTGDLTRICVHDKTSQQFLDEQKNRYNAGTFQWGTPGTQEANPKNTQCAPPMISTDVIDKLKSMSCSEKEVYTSKSFSDGSRADPLLASSKTAEPLSSKNTPLLILETNNNNNTKSSENSTSKCVSSENTETKAPTKRVRANHRRNLSLDFRAMGIVLPPLSEVAPSVSPPRILHNIPESPVPPPTTTNEAPPPAPAPAITPKIKHVVRRILSRRISRYE